METMDAEEESERVERVLDRYVTAKSIYHALTYNSQIPPSKEEQEQERVPQKVWNDIAKYRAFRKQHDAAWLEANDHPVSLYRFLGLDDTEVLGWFGEPPVREKPQVREGKLLDTFMERLEAKMQDV